VGDLAPCSGESVPVRGAELPECLDALGQGYRMLGMEQYCVHPEARAAAPSLDWSP
jgi:hypothetical protein